MHPLDVNLASRPFRNNALVWTAHLLAAGLLVAFTAWNARAFLSETSALRAVRGRMHSVEEKLADLDRREIQAETGTGKFDVADLTVRTAKANEFIARKALSWTRLFNLLEKVVPYEVKMETIRPLFATSRGSEGKTPEGSVPVGLQGTAQSLEAFLELERALITDNHFDRVEPEKSDVGAGGEVLFELQFLYFPEGKADRKNAPDLPHVLPAAAEEPASSAELRALQEAGGTVPSASAPTVPPPPPPAAARPGAGGPRPADPGAPRRRPPARGDKAAGGGGR